MIWKDLGTWQGVGNIRSREFTCGHCGKLVASEKGWYAKRNDSNQPWAAAHICHFCNNITYIAPTAKQYPGVKFGQDVEHIDAPDVQAMYDEARTAMQAGAPTSAVLACRKILMHVANSKGAKPNLRYIEYVDYLVSEHYVPPGSKEWVDKIREKGNEANHEISISTSEDAKMILGFIENLLRFVYELPGRAKKVG